MKPVGQKAVVRDLHGDRAEAFADAPGAQVAHERTQERVPIETVVLIEAPVFRGDERRLHRLRHRRNRHVHAPDVLEMAQKPIVAVEDLAALAGMERADLRGARAPRESARTQPRVKAPDSRNGEREQDGQGKADAASDDHGRGKVNTK